MRVEAVLKRQDNFQYCTRIEWIWRLRNFGCMELHQISADNRRKQKRWVEIEISQIMQMRVNYIGCGHCCCCCRLRFFVALLSSNPGALHINAAFQTPILIFNFSVACSYVRSIFVWNKWEREGDRAAATTAEAEWIFGIDTMTREWWQQNHNNSNKQVNYPINSYIICLFVFFSVRLSRSLLFVITVWYFDLAFNVCARFSSLFFFPPDLSPSHSRSPHRPVTECIWCCFCLSDC